MTKKFSAFGVIAGDAVDIASDIIPINDVSVAAASQNKIITPVELKVALIGERVPTLTTMSYTDNASGSVMSAFYNGARGLSLARTDGGTGSERVSLIGKAVPVAGNWSATSKFEFGPISGASQTYGGGMMLYNSSSHKFILWGAQELSGSLRMALISYTNLTTFNTDISASGWQYPHPPWFQIVESSTLYTFNYSFDGGHTWVTWSTASKATYFTADKVGFALTTSSSVGSFKPSLLVKHYDDPDIPL